MRLTAHRLLLPLLLILLLGYGLPARAKKPAPPDRWIGTWAAAPTASKNPAGTFGPQDPNQPGFTVRQVVHTSIGGALVRVILSNEFGTEPLNIGAVHAALSAGGPAILLPTANAVTFHHEASVTIAPGAIAISDEFALTLPPLSDLAVSIYLPPQPMHTITMHPLALGPGYLTAGNQVGARTFAAPSPLGNRLFLKGVDVELPAEDKATATAGAIVAFGDSITDGWRSTADTNNRWPDELARRIYAADPHSSGDPINPRLTKKTGRLGVLNEGISGNRILHDGSRPNALSRFDRDVLQQSGARYVIVLEGVNDIGHATAQGKDRTDAASAEELIAGFTDMINRAHAKGLKIYLATIVPYSGAKYFSPAGEQEREAVNGWIRSNHLADGVIDFDKVIGDPADPTRMKAEFDSGDHLHPSDAGYKAMGDSIDLSLFAK